MARVTVGTVMFFALLIAICFIEYKLARLEGKWPGLILPIISFAIALMGSLGNVMYTVKPDGSEPTNLLAPVAVSFLYLNIPTLILMLIYLYQRDKKTKKRNVEKMNIKDL